MGRVARRQRKPSLGLTTPSWTRPRRLEKSGVVWLQGRPPMDMHTPVISVAPERIAELERLGDQIAELSAHLEAAGARLLDLIRDFDARGGRNIGFRSCADWLSWRMGPAPGAGRERGGVGRARGAPPLPAPGP